MVVKFDRIDNFSVQWNVVLGKEKGLRKESEVWNKR